MQKQALAATLAIGGLGLSLGYLWVMRRRRILAAKLEEQKQLSMFEETPISLAAHGIYGVRGPPVTTLPLITVMDNGNINIGRISHIGPMAQRQSVAFATDFTRSPGGTAVNPPPEYTEKACDEWEQQIGVGGDRAGDTINSPPESREEAEEKRNREMEALYQIRLSRRTEQTERNERKKRRNIARQANDLDTLRALREEALVAARQCESEGSIFLIREYEGRPKTQKVASVYYHGVGIIRHDGSEIRKDTRKRSVYDFPDVTWEQDDSEMGSIRTQGTSSSSSSLKRSDSNGSTSTSCSKKECNHLAPPSTADETWLPTYSALERHDPAPPYFSPLPRAVTTDSANPISGRTPVVVRFSRASTQGLLAPSPSIRIIAETPVEPGSAHVNVWDTPSQHIGHAM